MSNHLGYTSRARRIAYNFPKFSYLSIQINFWILAYFLFTSITYLNILYLNEFIEIDIPLTYPMVIIDTIFLGLFVGLTTGILDIYMDKIGVRKLSFGLIMLIRIVEYPIILLFIIGMIKLSLATVGDTFFNGIYSELMDSSLVWRYLYGSMLIFTAFMAAILALINEMNNKFGPGILIPMMMGKYKRPKEQKRFFMFVDLKSSSEHAENLGHVNYSSMIQDCFLDLNKVLGKNNAEIYQYVGDEAVVTWPAEEGIKKMYCISLYYGFKARLETRREYYTKKYGFVPHFKAGLHLGIVTAVEVGDIKREIAYHGDTINTAARIQGVCNQYDKELLISRSVSDVLPDNLESYQLEPLGHVSLKGKHKTVELFSVEKTH